ncbi:MAG: PEP-CTERM sorting domain-containing protein, partial [Myxococcales bacterium]|nr:PEP-CTERM sorting domain-containing protein [Myxococcales bacterium]
FTQSIDVRVVGAGFTSVSSETALGGTCVAGLGCIPGAGFSLGGTQGTTVAGNYQAFSQIGGLAPGPNTNGMTPGSPFFTGASSLTAVFTTIAGAAGTYDIDMAPIGVGFFGITGPRTLGSYTVVPEPSTAALMGLGVLFLAMVGRRN